MQNQAIMNSINNVLVLVLDALGGIEIVASLKNIGFNAEIYQSGLGRKNLTLESINNNQGFWIGKRIEPKVAIKAIKAALKIWPDLKYLYITGDKSDSPDYVDDQIFIGGSNSSIIRYRLRGWSLEELNSLDEDMSIIEFHNIIREKYF